MSPGQSAQTHDQRGEAGPGMPSYYGRLRASLRSASEHLSNYCDQNDVAAGLGCNLSMTPDADQQFASLFGSGTYTSQTAVNTAKDYAINLIEPVAPAALRGDQLASLAGQDAAVRAAASTPACRSRKTMSTRSSACKARPCR